MSGPSIKDKYSANIKNIKLLRKKKKKDQKFGNRAGYVHPVPPPK